MRANPLSLHLNDHPTNGKQEAHNLCMDHRKPTANCVEKMNGDLM
jgi:hypothetical protein